MLFITEILEILPSAAKVARLDAERDNAKATLTAAETALQHARTGDDARAIAIAEAALSEAQAALDAFDYLPAAIRCLDSHGAYERFLKYGTVPAHVVPVMEPIRDHVAAVAAVRSRIIELDAVAAGLDDAVTAGELSAAWREVHATDIGIARLSLERLEEAIVCDAADHGVCIARRADLDPAAFLEIERA